MNSKSPLIFAALIGLVAGIGHGFVSHHADLPMLLTDQFLQPFEMSQVPKD